MEGLFGKTIASTKRFTEIGAATKKEKHYLIGDIFLSTKSCFEIERIADKIQPKSVDSNNKVAYAHGWVEVVRNRA